MDGLGIDVVGLLIQDFLEVHFLDAGFCEGLPEEEKEPHPVYFGKDPFTGLYRPSEHLLACIRYALLEERSVAEKHKNIDIYLKLHYNLLNVTSYFPHQEHIQLESIWYQVVVRSIHGKQSVILHIHTSGFYQSKHANNGTL